MCYPYYNLFRSSQLRAHTERRLQISGVYRIPTPSWWKNQYWLVRVGVVRPPPCSQLPSRTKLQWTLLLNGHPFSSLPIYVLCGSHPHNSESMCQYYYIELCAADAEVAVSSVCPSTLEYSIIYVYYMVICFFRDGTYWPPPPPVASVHSLYTGFTAYKWHNEHQREGGYPRILPLHAIHIWVMVMWWVQVLSC